MSFRLTNLFAPLPSGKIDEQILTLLDAPAFRLEHIISHGRPSSPGFWYDQPNSEWIVLMRGCSTLDFGEEGRLELKAGDCLLIPAHSRHRVETVSKDAVWLALHFSYPSHTP
jgi:cupin 2 domain-containing protein